jgi:hypothetical protein
MPPLSTIAGIACSIGVVVFCVSIGSGLPALGTSLNSKQVDDLLELLRIFIFDVVPALTLFIAYLSVTLWICSSKRRGDCEPPVRESGA